MKLMKFSLGKLFLMLVIIGSLLFLIRPIGDPDFWWHLKTGQLILETKSIPISDDYAFTYSGVPWKAPEWLTEVLMYCLYKLGGIRLVVFIFSLFLIAAFVLACFRAQKNRNPYWLGFALLLGVILSTPVLWARPQVFLILYVSIFVFLLDKYIDKKNVGYLIPLPIIMLFWVNQHGSFILGIALIVLFLLASWIDGYNEIRKSGTSYKKVVINRTTIALLLVIVICALVSILNPNGLRMFLYPFNTMTEPAQQEYIIEWASPNFHERTWFPLAVMFLTLLALGLRSRKAISTSSILLCIAFGYLTLLSSRFSALFAIVSIPVLTDILTDVFPFRWSEKSDSRIIRPLSVLLLLIGFAYGAWIIVHLEQKQSEYNERSFPIHAVTFIKESGIKGRIFNSYNWGGYLIWSMYPQNKVYIDGRADVFGTNLIRRFVDIYTTKPGWSDALLKDKIDYVLIEPNTYLAYALNESPLWICIYSDPASILYQYVP